MTPDSEISLKRAAVHALLDEHNLDGLLLVTPPSVSWITCGGDPVVDQTSPTGVAAVLCTREGEVLLTNTIEYARMMEEALPHPPGRAEVFAWYEAMPPVAARLLGEGAVLGADLAMPGFVDVSHAVSTMRLILSPSEQERYRGVCRDAGLAVEAAARAVKPGMSELEIAGTIAAESYARGGTPIVVLVAVDERITRYRHPLPTSRRLEKHALLVLCARRHGLVASVTRSIYGGRIPDDLRRRHEACTYVDAAMLEATRDGVLAGDVFARCQEAYAAVGFQDEWLLHHQGGAAGYQSREWLAGPGGMEEIHEGMAFAWNPSITGTKSEDTVILGPEGVEIATATGAWPTTAVTASGTTFDRPDILELGQ